MIEIKKIPYAPKGDWRLDKWEYLSEAQKMSKYINDGDVIFDCGANIFDHTVFFAINHKESKVVAFEPVKDYFEMGQKNIKHFGVKNIQSLNVALGDVRIKMSISIDNEGSSLAIDHIGSRKEEIQVETIDYLVENNIIPAPNFIKIDVEGFALPLIRGAKNTIMKYKPIVVIEVHPQFVGYKESVAKISELIKYGLVPVEKLDQIRELVLAPSGKEISWKKSLKKVALNEFTFIRNAYDSSKTRNEREVLSIKYKAFKKKTRPNLLKLLLWSKLYIFFTFRWVKQNEKTN